LVTITVPRFATLAIVGAMLLAPGVAHSQYPAASRRAVVVGFSAAYIGSALLGAHVAIRDSLPEAPFGIRSTRSVRSEFLAGGGTALSPGLVMLVAQAAVTGMTAGPTATSRKATHALAVGGTLYFAGQLCEPTAYRLLLHPRAAPKDRLAIVVANIVLPALMTGAAMRALR
jgi:hypothetical protein